MCLIYQNSLALVILTSFALLQDKALGDDDYDQPIVKLSSDGPVVLDATISFRVELFNVEGYQRPFYFSWSDDASPGHWDEQTSDNWFATWNVTYASKIKYEEREYKTTVRVYYSGLFGRDFLGEKVVKYRVTKNLNGDLVFEQKGPAVIGHDNIIRSTENTELSVKFHDPSGFLKSSWMQFFWFVNGTNYGPSENNSFTFKFFPPGHYTVEALVMAQVSSGNGLGNALADEQNRIDERPHPAALLTNSEELKSLSSHEIQQKAPPYLKTGVFRSEIESRTPITKFNYTGETWIKTGQLLEVTMECDGSGPWTGCWSTRQVPYNMTGNETCSSDDIMILNGDCSFPIIWYFRQPGFHNILAIVDNKVSKRSQLILTNMYNSTMTPPISVVVIPVASGLVGLLGIGFGVITFFYCRRKVAIETADFDFNSPEEQLEYKTFWERLRDSMMNAFSNSSDDVSHVSSVSSRSIQHPITSIHYGSIS